MNLHISDPIISGYQKMNPYNIVFIPNKQHINALN